MSYQEQPGQPAPYQPQQPQPYGQPSPQQYAGPPAVINVQAPAGHGRSVTRAYIPTSWHIKHWVLLLCTGGMSAPWYWWGYHKRRRPVSITTHER